LYKKPLSTHLKTHSMKKLVLALAVHSALGLSSCQDKKEQSAMLVSSPPAASMIAMEEPQVLRESEESTDEVPDQAELSAGGPSTDAVPGAPAAPAQRVMAGPRLLIYRAEVRLRVNNMARTSARLDSLVRRSGGYLSASQQTRDDDISEWRQEMTIRVRPGRFQSLLTALDHLGTVENKKLSTDDVTAQHADVSARLRTKRAVEQRYVALLSKAQKIKDILDIEEKIGQVREEIESTESRLKTLNDEVTYSTIQLTCYQPIAQAVPDAPVISLASRVVEAFYGGWSLLTSLLVGVVGMWPLLLLGAAAWWGVRRWRLRLRQHSQA
jgi:hypothetical protein